MSPNDQTGRSNKSVPDPITGTGYGSGAAPTSAEQNARFARFLDTDRPDAPDLDAPQSSEPDKPAPSEKTIGAGFAGCIFAAALIVAAMTAPLTVSSTWSSTTAAVFVSEHYRLATNLISAWFVLGTFALLAVAINAVHQPRMQGLPRRTGSLVVIAVLLALVPVSWTATGIGDARAQMTRNIEAKYDIDVSRYDYESRRGAWTIDGRTRTCDSRGVFAEPTDPVIECLDPGTDPRSDEEPREPRTVR